MTHVQGWSNAGSAALGLPDQATGERLLVSPLQMALAAASLSNGGVRPAPRLAVAVNTPQSGWVILPPGEQPVSVVSSESAQAASQMLAIPGLPGWQLTARAWDAEGKVYSWYLGGTQLSWPGAPLALAVLIEEDDPLLAVEIGGRAVASCHAALNLSTPQRTKSPADQDRFNRPGALPDNELRDQDTLVGRGFLIVDQLHQIMDALVTQGFIILPDRCQGRQIVG